MPPVVKSEFRATGPEDADRIAAFLVRVFREEVGATFIELANLAWKYWTPRFDWKGSRSYVLERHGEIAAHSGVWPLELRSESKTWKVIHLIDWAAGEWEVGAGVVLLHRLAKMADMVLAIGGSDQTRRIMPSLGFREVGNYQSFARPVRPFQQAMAHQYRNWKLPARWLRNTAWSLFPRGGVSADWSAEQVSPEALDERALPRPPAQLLLCTRKREWFAYLRDCPCARFELLQLRKKGDVAGYISISFVPGIARIGDLWVQSNKLEDWTAAYRLATALAGKPKDVFEVQASSSLRLRTDALIRAGYRRRGDAPVLVLDPKRNFPAGGEFSVQMIDYDEAFRRGARPFFQT